MEYVCQINVTLYEISLGRNCLSRVRDGSGTDRKC